MLAFLKRRWILLSCAAVLLACSVVDLRWITCLESMSPKTVWDPMLQHPLISRITVRERSVFAGSFLYRYDNDAWVKVGDSVPPFQFQLHFPQFGRLPVWNTVAIPHRVSIPVWIPLAATFGWLVVRELRWQERRGKTQSLQ